MKIVLLAVCCMALILGACGEKKKTEVKEIEQETVGNQDPGTEAKGSVDYIALGKKLFTEKTCVTCHQIDTKVIGPSVKDILKIYDENDASIIAFLKGNMDPIVDTDPGQVAIMKANLDGFVKDLTDDELKALEAYMLSVN